MLALAEAIIPGTSSIPAADDTTVREVTRAGRPAVAEAGRRVDRGAPRAGRGRPAAHRASVPRAAPRRASSALLASMGAGPAVPRRRSSLIASVYKVVHFDAPHVQRAMGARPRPPLPVTEPRWAQQAHAAESWTGGDVECDVVVDRAPGRVGRWSVTRSPSAGTRWSSSRRGSSTIATASTAARCGAYERFYRPVFALGNATFPVFVGRMVGGSTAINGGTAFRTPNLGARPLVRGDGHRRLRPARMEPYFERVETHLGVAPASRRHVGAHRRGDAAGLRRAGLEARAAAPERAGVRGLRLLPSRLPERRAARAPTSPICRRRWSAARPLFTGLKAERVLLENGRATGIEGVASNGNRIRVRARAVVLAGGTISTPLFLLRQGLANSSGQVGRNLTVHPSCGRDGALRRGDPRVRPHPAGLRLGAVPATRGCCSWRRRRPTTPCPACSPPSAAA